MATAVLCVKPFSDADEVNNHPRKARGPTIEWTKNDDFWTRRIGQRWAKHLGLDPPFEEYRLDNLPTGYAGYVRPKIYGDPSSVRLNYLYGHPSGSRYNSGESFWPHFVWLQEGMEGECECKLCGKGKSKKSTPMVWEEGQDEEDAIDDEEEEVGEGVIPINSFSDGDSKKRPRLSMAPNSEWTRNNDCWTQLLGEKWAPELNLPPPYDQYKLNRLPKGYTGYSRPKVFAQPSSKTINFLYGHPSGERFWNADGFWPHFKWLMEGMDGTCSCNLCLRAKLNMKESVMGETKPHVVIRRRPHGADRRQQVVDQSHVDTKSEVLTIPDDSHYETWTEQDQNYDADVGRESLDPSEEVTRVSQGQEDEDQEDEAEVEENDVDVQEGEVEAQTEARTNARPETPADPIQPNCDNVPGFTILPINSTSDGNERHRPFRVLSNKEFVCKPDWWLRNLAIKWAAARNLPLPHDSYRLDRLPDGYAGFVRPVKYGQPSSGTLHYLYGHPSGKRFQSGDSFFPHFKWLMDGMEGMCECIVCQGPKKRPNRPDPQYGWEPRILPIRPFSDGDASKHAHIQLTPNDDWWLRKLASVKWAHDLNLPWVPGGYKLDALPEGYAGFQQIKPGAREKIQHWIIGHPSGAKCKGVEKFWPHFKWLMDGMVGECQCTLCVVKGAKRESETKRKHEASLKGGGGNAVDERNGKYSRMESDGGQVPGTSTVSGGDISSAQMVESGPSMMHVDGNERDEVRYDVPDRMNNNPHQNGSRVDAGYVTPQWTR